MTIEERIVCLERELAGAKRRMQILITVVVWIGLTATSFAIVHAFNEKPVRVIRADQFIAREFIVEDANQTTRARLTTIPGFLVTNEGIAGVGKPELTESLLALYDAKGGQRVLMGANMGRTHLSMSGGNGNEQIGLDVTNDRPAARLTDQDGKFIWMAPPDRK